jgi:hypothetical protein
LPGNIQHPLHEELLAPDFNPQELAHIQKRAERPGRIAVGKVGIIWVEGVATPPVLVPVSSLTPRAIDISSTPRIGVHD